MVGIRVSSFPSIEFHRPFKSSFYPLRRSAMGRPIRAYYRGLCISTLFPRRIFIYIQADLAVHKKKVEDVRRWFVEAFEGGPSGKLRKYRVSSFSSFLFAPRS
jgi:hypothetical protein